MKLLRTRNSIITLCNFLKLYESSKNAKNGTLEIYSIQLKSMKPTRNLLKSFESPLGAIYKSQQILLGGVGVVGIQV